MLDGYIVYPSPIFIIGAITGANPCTSRNRESEEKWKETIEYTNNYNTSQYYILPLFHDLIALKFNRKFIKKYHPPRMNNGTFYLSGTALSRQMKRLPSFIKHDETETDKLVFPLGDLKELYYRTKKIHLIPPIHTS